MEMESPDSFTLKEEPASPSWELELFDEVGGTWEGDVAVIDGEVDLDVDNNTFWGEQDVSEFIGKEEEILGLELEEIILEDQENEGNLESFYPPDNRIRFDTGVIGIRCNNIVAPAPLLVKVSCADRICTDGQTVCADRSCAESMCMDASCSERPCTDAVCNGVANPFQLFAQTDFTNAIQPVTDWPYVKMQGNDDFLPNANDNVPKPVQHPYTETFTSWLDSGAVYDGPNSIVSGLPTFNTTSLWSAPESPSDEKAAAFSSPAVQPAAAADSLQGPPTDLFKEFEDVLSQAAGSLTPPDSPRSASAYGAQALLQLNQNLQPMQLSPASGQRFIVLQEMASSPAVNDELDELMAETYQQTGGTTISGTGSSISSNATKPKGRPWDSPSASSSGCSDSGYDDPEWSPAKSAESGDSDGPPQAKKRCLTSTEERRLRKKEQNKNAATRYRMKKKMEMEEIIGEEKELMDRNDTLKSDVVEITREIKYLKSLMGDLFRAKGLIRAK